MIIDIVLIVLFVIIIFAAVKKGFLSSLFGLASLIASSYLSFKFSGAFAKLIYDSFMREHLIKRIEKAVENGYDSSSNSMFGEQITKAMTSMTDKTQIAEYVTDNYLADISLRILDKVAFVVMFLVLSFVIAYVAKLIVGLIKVTPFKKLDSLLGGCLGVVKATVIVAIICVVLSYSVDFITEKNQLNSVYKPEATTSDFSKFSAQVDDSKVIAFTKDNVLIYVNDFIEGDIHE